MESPKRCRVCQKEREENFFPFTGRGNARKDECARCANHFYPGELDGFLAYLGRRMGRSA